MSKTTGVHEVLAPCEFRLEPSDPRTWGTETLIAPVSRTHNPAVTGSD